MKIIITFTRMFARLLIWLPDYVLEKIETSNVIEALIAELEKKLKKYSINTSKLFKKARDVPLKYLKQQKIK